MRNHTLRLSLALLAFAGMNSMATEVAELPDKGKAIADQLKNYSIELTVPDSPALSMLGIAPSTALKPSSLREFAVSLARIRTPEGRIKGGLAMDFAPFQMTDGLIPISLADYRSNFLARMAWNTQLSVATVGGKDDSDKSVRIGAGLSFKLLDDNDYRMNNEILICYKVALLLAVPQPGKPANKDLAEEETGKCNKSFKNSLRWNASRWDLSIGKTWISENGELSERKAAASGVWTSYAWGFDSLENSFLHDRSQLVFYARTLNKEQVADPKNAGKFISRNTNALALKFITGTTSRALSLEGSYSRSKYKKLPSENVRRFALGYEQQLSDQLWLVASLGGEGGRQDGKDKPFALASFKYALSQKSLGIAPK